MLPLPTDSARIYERVRADVMAGLAGAEVLGAIIFHGMWQGLRVLSTVTAAASSFPVAPPASVARPAGTLDRQLVRLLADMVLATQ